MKINEKSISRIKKFGRYILGNQTKFRCIRIKIEKDIAILVSNILLKRVRIYCNFVFASFYSTFYQTVLDRKAYGFI